MKKLLWCGLYSIIAAILCVIGGYGSFMYNFIYTLITIFVGVMLSEYFFKANFSTTMYDIINVFLLIVIGGFIFFGDSKDRDILLLLTGVAFIVGVVEFIIRAGVRKEEKSRHNFMRNIASSFVLYAVAISFTQIANLEVFANSIGFDFFNLLIALFAWRLVTFLIDMLASKTEKNNIFS